MSVGPRTENFIIVSDDNEHTRKCDFSVLDRKYPFWANLVQKIKTVNLNWNLELDQFEYAELNGNAFSFFDWKYPFWVYVAQKIKIITLSWNLVPTLIRICRVQCWCSLFLFPTGNNPFCANLVQKIKIVNLRWNLAPRLIRIYRIQWWSSVFPFWNGNTIFGQIWSKESKLSA